MAKAVISLVSKELLEEHLLSLTQRLLDAIANGDWTTYTEIVDESATCLEPEAGALMATATTLVTAAPAAHALYSAACSFC